MPVGTTMLAPSLATDTGRLSTVGSLSLYMMVTMSVGLATPLTAGPRLAPGVTAGITPSVSSNA